MNYAIFFFMLILSFVSIHTQAEWKLELDMKIPLPYSGFEYRPVAWNSNGKKVYTGSGDKGTSLAVVDVQRGVTAIISGARYPIASIAYKHSGPGGIATCDSTAGSESEFRLWDVSAKSSEPVTTAPSLQYGLFGVASGPGNMWATYQYGYQTVPPGTMFVLDGTRLAWHAKAEPPLSKSSTLSGVAWNEYTGEFLFGRGPLFNGVIAYNTATHSVRTLSSPLESSSMQYGLKCVKGTTFLLGKTFPGNAVINYLVQWKNNQIEGVASQLGNSQVMFFDFDINDGYVAAFSPYGDSPKNQPPCCQLFNQNDLENYISTVSYAMNEVIGSVAFNPRNNKQLAVATNQALYLYSLVFTNGPEEFRCADETQDGRSYWDTYIQNHTKQPHAPRIQAPFVPHVNDWPNRP